MTAADAAAGLLSVARINVAFRVGPARIQAVRDVSFAVGAGEVVALVGESGSGKSTVGLALMGLHPSHKAEVGGAIRIRRKDGSRLDIVGAPERELRRLRGDDVAMIFQEPMASLNPVRRIGDQIVEAIRVHRPMPRLEAWKRARDMLAGLGVPGPEERLASYPHQLSGGMRQRVMIAIALSCEPALLVADEPTTALDVTIQAQIVDLLKGLQARTRMSMLFISHDLGLVGQVASRILVMYAGRIVEEGSLPGLFERPRMPYTRALLRSRPRLDAIDRPIEPIPGSVPNLARLPPGCAFHPRCPHAVPGLCDVGEPLLEGTPEGGKVRCHRWREIGAT